MKFLKTTKSKLSILIIMVMVFQVFMPMVGNVAWADGSEDTETEMIEEEIITVQEDQEDINNLEDPDGLGEKQENPKDIEDGNKQEEDKQGEKILKNKFKGIAIQGIKPMSGGTDLGNIFTDVVLTLDDVEIEDGSIIGLEDGQNFQFKLNWELDDTVNLADGDFATMNLPDKLQLLRDEEGDLLDSDKEVIARYYLTKNDNKIKVVFNDKLVGLGDRSGDFWLSFEFNKDKFNDDATQKIEFETEPEKDFTITLKPKTGETIKKEGIANASINASEITWTVDINTKLDTITNAIIKDNLPAGLTLSDIKVYNLTVGYDGSLSEGTRIKEDQTGFPVELGTINSAYRIIYKTEITDKKESFENEAILESEGVETNDKAIVPTPTGSMIDKLDGTPDQNLNATEIKWIIQANLAETTLKGAKVRDVIKDKLVLQKNSEDMYNVKVYKLIINTDGTKTRGEEVTITPEYDETSKELVVNLGDINSAYEIEYVTDIRYGNTPADYGKEFIFENTARLTETKDEGETEVGESTSEATVTRGEMATKGGEGNIQPNSKKIDWTIKVNEAEDVIYDIWVEDKSGDGIEYIPGSVVVKDKNNNILTEGTHYTLQVPSAEGNDFKVILAGRRAELYTVEYSTRITDYNEENFKNAASISWIPGKDGEVGETGDGTGEGEGGTGGEGDRIYKPIEKDVTAPVLNTYAKAQKGVNYNAKTMSWEIKQGFYKGITKDLVLTDTFPNNGMVFLENTLKIQHKVDGVTTELTKGTDYTVGKREDSYGKGFIIEFLGEYNTTKFVDSELTITYKTSFDPNDSELIVNETKVYKNRVDFSGDVVYAGVTTPIEQDKEARITVKDIAFNNGEKKGTLDRDARKISWKIFTNFMEKDLTGDEFVVTDTLSNGQEFDSTSLTVKKYTINDKGVTSITADIVDASSYDVVETTDGFTLTFANGIKERYVVEFDTDIKGISNPKYSNSAEVTASNKLEAEVDYENHNDFLFKNATDIDNNRVWIDDEINWKLTINDSLSEIQNAVITDTISQGLVFVNDSVKIFKSDDTELDPSKYVVATEIVDEKTVLTITFNNEINEKYTVHYKTVVVTKTGEISNNAKFTGDGIEEGEGTKEEVKANVTQSAGGTGSGREKKGSIVIKKLDTKVPAKPITAEAEFEIYYMLNGVKRLVEDQTHKTINGKIELFDLTFRTYYIKEVTPPKGFKFNLDEPPIEVEVNRTLDSEEGAYKFDIENDNIKTEAKGTKVWIDGPEEKPTIYLQLLRNGVAIQDPVELASGTLTHEWTNLDLTDNAGVGYEYTVQEVNEDGADFTPENYRKVEDGLKVTNTYVSPKTEIIGTKEWVNGPEEKPTIYLQLLRNDVALRDPVELVNGTLTHEWINLDLTDSDGVGYEYKVQEVDEDGVDFTPENYTKVETGLTVTNTYVSPKTEVTGKKVWIDGPDVKPTIELQLYRDSEPLEDKVATLVSGETEYTWTNLDLTDNAGREYVYTVDEVATPENYGATRSEDLLSVTNTYGSPVIDITGRKVWVGGPEEKPAIELQLYKNGEPLGQPVELEDGTYEHVWKGLEKTDRAGVDHEYIVKEVDTPENYEKTEVGLTVTNTYVSPKTEVTGRKIWIGGRKEKPTIKIQLYRNGEAFGKPVALRDRVTEYTWTDLDLNDQDAKEYIYTIDEVEVPKYHRKTISKDGLTITNEYDETLEFDDPDNPLGPTDPGLPKTGQGSNMLFYLAGLGLIGLGFTYRRKDIKA